MKLAQLNRYKTIQIITTCGREFIRYDTSTNWVESDGLDDCLVVDRGDIDWLNSVSSE